ncbi:hypothetical protein OG235_50520 [Streptomyces sp. NBC_00024]|uniref:hypothetical protein n=1 Tax=Streptomyces sp. NBC_00024 TaxID=2903612 RepID=UPI0032477212
MTDLDHTAPSGRPDYVAQVATVPFLLGRPEELPATGPRIRDAAAGRAAQVLGRLSGPGARDSLAGLLSAARTARDELTPTGTGPVGEDPEESEANGDNDLAFGIVRTRGPAAELLVDAGVHALIGILEVAADHGSDLDAPTWQRFLGGFDALFGWLADPGRAPAVSAMPAAGPPAAPAPQDALRRWVRGHHVFMVFAQAATTAARVLQNSAEHADPGAAAAAAAATVELMRGCHGALAYAGSANRDQYNEQIRPTLMPPVAPPKMSGLHWRDHEALIVELGRSGPAWQWLEARRPGLLGEFRHVLGEAYDAHRGVCGHFVGDMAPSLLATQRSSRSAVGVLSQLRRVRLGALPTPADPDATAPNTASHTAGPDAASHTTAPAAADPHTAAPNTASHTAGPDAASHTTAPAAADPHTAAPNSPSHTTAPDAAAPPHACPADSGTGAPASTPPAPPAAHGEPT